MNLMVFGAGASYGSDSRGPLPPLGGDLLDELVNFAPNAWGKLPEKYKVSCRTDFEQGMQLLSKEIPQSLPPLQRAMAAYFFEFIPRNSNLYLKLAYLIKSSEWNKDGRLVSFNYERLLPICLAEANLQPAVGVEEIENNQIELCLPHGTCNLFCSGVRASTNVLFHGTGVSFDGGAPQCIVDKQRFYQRLNSDAIPPIMSYFNPQKTNASGRSFIINQRKRYEELVQKSDKIVIVGLKVREHDTHIWNPIANTNAEIVYCAGKSGAVEFIEWSKENRHGKKDTIFEDYFAECFEAICSEMEIK